MENLINFTKVYRNNWTLYYVISKNKFKEVNKNYKFKNTDINFRIYYSINWYKCNIIKNYDCVDRSIDFINLIHTKKQILKHIMTLINKNI